MMWSNRKEVSENKKFVFWQTQKLCVLRATFSQNSLQVHLKHCFVTQFNTLTLNKLHGRVQCEASIYTQPVCIFQRYSKECIG